MAYRPPTVGTVMGMGMLRWVLPLAGLAVLGGCAAPLDVASVTEIRSHTGSKSIDVYEPKRTAGQAAVPQFAGDQLVEVRTFVFKDGSGQMEVAGASCSLSAADYSATLRSPGKVRVPLYRAQSSPLAVTCDMPGYKKKMVTVSAIDITRQGRLASGSNGGLIGVVAVAAIDAMADNTNNDWAYPVARVDLEPETLGKVATKQ